MGFCRSRAVVSSFAKYAQDGMVKQLLSSEVIGSWRTYSSKKQKLLPMHVLPLKEVMDRFMRSVAPLLKKKEMKKQKKISQDFQSKEGKELQGLLEAVGKKEKNWLAPRWLKVAYLQYRLPVTVHVSPGMTFPFQEFKDKNAFIKFVSKVIFGLGEFNDLVHAGKIPVVKMGKLELDNGQFGLVFGTCRIPKRITDGLVYNPCSDYVAVVYMNHFYKLPIYSKDGKLLTAGYIASQLKAIMKKEKKPGVPFGLLSTDSRDNWAESYEHLTNNERNSKAVKTIQGSMFTVSLDKCTSYKEDNRREKQVLSIIHGGGSKENSGNRWMDKTIQLCCNPNGNVGFTYEHSPAEGQPIAMMMDYVMKKMKEDPDFGACGSKDGIPAKKIKFCPLNDCIDQWLVIAKRNIDKLVRNTRMKVLKYNCYGKGFIKKQKLGPDSYVQIALQLAYYTMYKRPTPQYESAHLRIFDGGRTETIRSCSIESVDFCKSMADDSKVPDKKRAEKLRKAVSGHQAYTRLALQGKGVDRHLLGLRLMAAENCKPTPKFFSSPGFVKSAHFTMATSQVATKYNAFMAYGAVVDDGYACCYNPRENDIILAISTWAKCQTTDPKKFAKILENSFDRMANLLQCNPAPEKPKKKC